MAKAKGMTYEELMEYARAHYASGGDVVFECWDERTFDEYVRDCGAMTKRKALQLFRMYKDTMDDMLGW